MLLNLYEHNYLSASCTVLSNKSNNIMKSVLCRSGGEHYTGIYMHMCANAGLGSDTTCDYSSSIQFRHHTGDKARISGL